MLRCPKLSVMLRAPATSSAALVPVFEASLQQVCAGLTAGSEDGGQLQSGAGPLSAEVRAPWRSTVAAAEDAFMQPCDVTSTCPVPTSILCHPLLQVTCQSLRVVSAPLMFDGSSTAGSTATPSAVVWNVDGRRQLPLLECPPQEAASSKAQQVHHRHR